MKLHIWWWCNGDNDVNGGGPFKLQPWCLIQARSNQPHSASSWCHMTIESGLEHSHSGSIQHCREFHSSLTSLPTVTKSLKATMANFGVFAHLWYTKIVSFLLQANSVVVIFEIQFQRGHFFPAYLSSALDLFLGSLIATSLHFISMGSISS